MSKRANGWTGATVWLRTRQDGQSADRRAHADAPKPQAGTCAPGLECQKLTRLPPQEKSTSHLQFLHEHLHSSRQSLE